MSKVESSGPSEGLNAVSRTFDDRLENRLVPEPAA